MSWSGSSITIAPDAKYDDSYEAKINTHTKDGWVPFSIHGLVPVTEHDDLRITMPLYYHKINLQMILRNHEIMGVYDDGEKVIRKSFDAMLDFFVKLEYLYDTLGIVKRNELEYFEYYYKKAADIKAVVDYIQTYEFPLKGIHDQLKFENSSIGEKRSKNRLTEVVTRYLRFKRT